MAISAPNRGWTVASLLPTLASGFSPGSSVGSKLAPAQVSGNPRALAQGPITPQTPQANSTLRANLLKQILGNTNQLVQPKNPGTNPAANSLSNVGYQFPSLLSKI